MGMNDYLTTYYKFLKSVVSVNIHICKETANLSEEAVRYHDQTGGKFSRFESGDAHFRRSTGRNTMK
jgi:hypothetical protein